ncbi:hypothetical protein BDV26DRAFT_292524 [Aspergillus bertholletiae]|uniref:Uncharacterized protein n=1 Tax=Aspergillus bertholletiae TaxID=1226010 RepID=A0A5N7B8T2_9EURO|nr:hypothetical protein BDV26DRAFT_292524 [Aspergillus bertholletiae]
MQALIHRRTIKWGNTLRDVQKSLAPGQPPGPAALQTAQDATEKYLRSKSLTPGSSVSDARLRNMIDTATADASWSLRILAGAHQLSAPEVADLQAQYAKVSATLTEPAQIRDALHTVSMLASMRPEVFRGQSGEDLRRLGSVLITADGSQQAVQLARLMVHLGTPRHPGAPLIPAVKLLLGDAITCMSRRAMERFMCGDTQAIAAVKRYAATIEDIFAAEAAPAALLALSTWEPGLAALDDVVVLRTAAGERRHPGLTLYVDLFLALRGPARDLEAVTHGVLGSQYVNLERQVIDAGDLAGLTDLEIPGLGTTVFHLHAAPLTLQSLVVDVLPLLRSRLATLLRNEYDAPLDLPFDLLQSSVISPEQAAVVGDACSPQAADLRRRYELAKAARRAGDAFQADEHYGVAVQLALAGDMRTVAQAVHAERLAVFVEAAVSAFAAHPLAPEELLPWKAQLEMIDAVNEDEMLAPVLRSLLHWRPDVTALTVNAAMESDYPSLFSLLRALAGPSRGDAVQGIRADGWSEVATLAKAIAATLPPDVLEVTLQLGGSYWHVSAELLRSTDTSFVRLQQTLIDAHLAGDSDLVTLLHQLAVGTLDSGPACRAAATLANTLAQTYPMLLQPLLDAVHSFHYRDVLTHLDAVLTILEPATDAFDALLTWLRRPALVRDMVHHYWNTWIDTAEEKALADVLTRIYPLSETCPPALRALREWQPTGEVYEVQRTLEAMSAALAPLSLSRTPGATALLTLLRNLTGPVRGAAVQSSVDGLVNWDGLSGCFPDQMAFVGTLHIAQSPKPRTVTLHLGDIDERCDVKLQTRGPNVGQEIIRTTHELAGLLLPLCRRARDRYVPTTGFHVEDLTPFATFLGAMPTGDTLEATRQNMFAVVARLHLMSKEP